jgi:hypothetical protein
MARVFIASVIIAVTMGYGKRSIRTAGRGTEPYRHQQYSARSFYRQLGSRRAQDGWRRPLMTDHDCARFQRRSWNGRARLGEAPAEP